MKIAALIVAAGRGSRIGEGLPKQYRPLGREMVLQHSIRAFDRHPATDSVQVVIHPDDTDLYATASRGFSKLRPFCTGGATRQQSVLAGLKALAQSRPGFVLIHDGARPFISAALISAILDRLVRTEGVLPCIPVSDTLIRRNPDAMKSETVPRDNLWRAQTPQGFRFAEIFSACQKFAGIEHTDDASLARAAGMEIAYIEGSPYNIKLTRPEDFNLAEHYLDTLMETRTGFGFDAHRFSQGTQVTLCGVEIPHTYGLEGHSDADAGLHALTDAVLGTISKGDIGMHFPPSDQQWRGQPSETFLRHAVQLLEKEGGQILHVDVTLICEAPVIAPYRDAMRKRMANILGLSIDRVSVKATTTERMGFTGRREGIAAQALATVRLPREEEQP